jgi:hypothetical protein
LIHLNEVVEVNKTAKINAVAIFAKFSFKSGIGNSKLFERLEPSTPQFYFKENNRETNFFF